LRDVGRVIALMVGQ